MNTIKALGKCLDQPILIAKLNKAMPIALLGLSAGYTAHKTICAPKDEKKNTSIRTGVILASTAMAAIAAPHISSALTKRALPNSLKEVKNNNKNIVDEFIRNSKPNNETTKLLKKSKDKILNIKEIKQLNKNLEGTDIFEKLIPSPQNITAKDIFSEIGYLSIYGAVPVLGGVIGGLAAESIVDKKELKNKMPNKIKEGFYQYLANIFMCNIGAGVALGILEKMGIKSKSARAIGMTIGIITTGIICGSKIANYLGKKLIDPLFKQECNEKRTPEMVDIGLHVDDIATVSLLSGLKWIEPSLPILYSVSGYKAGIGYRN